MSILQSNDVQDVLDALLELIENEGANGSVDNYLLRNFLDQQTAIYAPACGECAA